jgi:hypothetical protein
VILPSLYEIPFPLLLEPELRLWEEAAYIIYISVALSVLNWCYKIKQLAELFQVEICSLCITIFHSPYLGLSEPEDDGTVVDQSVETCSPNDTA